MTQYISRYSNNKTVSAAQYITELICERKAFRDKKDLHYRFWEHKTWAAFFRNQIGSAHKLLKKYDAKAIINALLSPQAQKIYSLRAPHLLPMIEQAQDKLLKEEQTQKQARPVAIDRKDKVNFGRHNQPQNNILSKLKDLE